MGRVGALLKDLMDGPAPWIVCGCCDRSDSECDLRRFMPGWVATFEMPELMCSDCFRCWYSGGMTDPDVIKAHVLSRTQQERKDG